MNSYDAACAACGKKVEENEETKCSTCLGGLAFQCLDC